MALYKEIDISLAKEILPQRVQDSNKGTYGKVLNISGCFNYQGAAYLSSVAPLKVGAGLVTLASIENVINNLSSTTPWVTFFPLRDYYNKCIASDAFNDLKDVVNNYNVISVGSGLSVLPAVNAFVDDFLKYFSGSDKKIVIDADALNILSQLECKSLPVNSVITPHPMEMSRLLDVSLDEIQKDRIGYAKKAAEKFLCTVVLKGLRTVVCTKNLNVYVNTSGNSSLAKAGSGDVLTGMIAGFMAQGLSSENAAILGVYMHGLSGEIASLSLTEYSVLATDIVDCIPYAIKKIKGEVQ